MRLKLSYMIGLFLICWIWILFYFLGPSLWNYSNSKNEAAGLQRQIHQLHQELKNVQKENSQLRTLVKEINSRKDSNEEEEAEEREPLLDRAYSKIMDGPSLEYELTRRQIKRDIDEYWRFIRGKIAKYKKLFKDKNAEFEKELETLNSESDEHYYALLVLMDKLSDNDGHALWRKTESQELSDLVQRRLTHLQNPENCGNARKLVCNLNKGCGYGCQIHHAVYCYLVAYGTERTLILKSKGWRYDKAGFEDVYLPLSDTCPKVPPPSEAAVSRASWPGKKDTVVVDIPIVDSVNPRPPYLPPSIPRDLSDRIRRLHGDPIVWWVSEFLRYMLRPQDDLHKLLKTAENDKLPPNGVTFIGIHVRRTDKVGTEAAFHPVEEYMKHVVDRFKYLDLKNGGEPVERHVYVASDDPKVLAECRKKFPDYIFYGDSSVAKSAAVSSRYTSNSLKGVITDIHLLSLSDYLVCTFSSQVCRIAYEMMQNRFVDGYDRFKSLDDIWYYGGQDEHQQEAIWAHEPKTREEIELKIGDVIGVAGNHWNGFNKGKLHRNNRIGLYPEFKTREKIKIVDFPTYPQVKHKKK